MLGILGTEMTVIDSDRDRKKNTRRVTIRERIKIRNKIKKRVLGWREGNIGN
jgi:hypothetical protein